MRRQKLTSLCARLKITADVTFGGTVPEGWTPGTNPWKVTLKCEGRRLTVPFYTGPAITREPTAADVLSCITSDANAGEQSFEDFCSDFGWERDRKARATWQTCRKLAPRVRKFLGEHFDAVLNAEH